MDYLTPSLPLIAALQKLHFLLAPAKIFSLLGNEEFFLLVLPLIYWCVNRQTGARLGVLLLFSSALNDVLKLLFWWPRPYWLNPNLQQATETTFGFPSGHAQNAVVVWGFLAARSRSPKLWLPLAAILALLVASSRVVLGVHFPADVIGGLNIGLALLGLGIWQGERSNRWWQRLPWPLTLLFSLMIVGFLGGAYWLFFQRSVPSVLALKPSWGYNSVQDAIQDAALDAWMGKGIVSRTGALFGLLVGLSLVSPLDFSANGPAPQRAARFLVGVVGILLFWRGLQSVLPDSLFFRFARYALTTFWVAYGAPWLFLKINLMSREKIESNI